MNEHLRGTFRDPRVVTEHSPDHEVLGTVRAFESLPLFSGRSTLEGLYMQASPTAPFVFYTQSAKAFRVETLRRFADGIDRGSSYVLEICYLTHRSRDRITQIPVSCEDWRASKFNLLHEAVYKFGHLFRLWLLSLRR